jgi:hypothetical protein
MIIHRRTKTRRTHRVRCAQSLRKQRLRKQRSCSCRRQRGGKTTATGEIIPDVAIFFDNAQKHIDELTSHCKPITCIKINETFTKTTADLDLPHTSDIYTKFISDAGLAENTYYKILQLITDTEKYDPASGMQIEHFNILEKWIADTRLQPHRSAIFDWDRTITMIEGMIIPPSWKDPLHGWSNYIAGIRKAYSAWPDAVAEINRIGEVDVNNTLLYLCGGAPRLRMIRSMMQMCVDNDVKIVILTNNSACGSFAFDDLVCGIMPDEIAPDIICSREYAGHKGEAILSNSYFKKFCATPASTNYGNLYN